MKKILSLMIAFVCLSATASNQPPTPDLTYAAEKAVNSVVYIKVTQAGKTRTYQYVDPFEDFFGDFFGRGGCRRYLKTVSKTGFLYEVLHDELCHR